MQKANIGNIQDMGQIQTVNVLINCTQKLILFPQCPQWTVSPSLKSWDPFPSTRVKSPLRNLCMPMQYCFLIYREIMCCKLFLSLITQPQNANIAELLPIICMLRNKNHNQNIVVKCMMEQCSRECWDHGLRVQEAQWAGGSTGTRERP